jgi:hypothetical protein
MKEFDRLYQQERQNKDSFYANRDSKEKLKKTGGAKSESPVWKDDDE